MIKEKIFLLLTLLLISVGWGCIDGVEVDLWDECYNIIETTTLNLFESNLSGEIPEDIGELVNLISLILPFNQLTGGIPQSISNLENLEIYLFYNFL